jgi:hypothetical protein
MEKMLVKLSLTLTILMLGSIGMSNTVQASPESGVESESNSLVAQQVNPVVGRWRYTVSTQGNASSSTSFGNSFVMADYTFRADGTFNNNMPRINKGGRYEVSGNMLTLNYSDGGKEEYQYELVTNTYSFGDMHSIRLTDAKGETRQFGLWDSDQEVYQ